MDSPNYDNTGVGQVHKHPKAATAQTPERNQSGASSVAGRMMLAVVAGAFFGYLLSNIIATDFALAFFIGGAMSFGAVAAALMIFRSPPTIDEYSTGNARTEEEVRQALADIEARKK